MQRDAQFISIGRISSAHGIKGALNVRPYGSDSALVAYPYLFIKSGSGYRKYDVAWARPKKPGSIILKLSDIDDRNGAEELSGSEIYITRDMFPDAGPDEDYWQDIIGLYVELSDGTPVGTIKNILETGAHDIYVVRSRGGDEILIPAVKEIVKAVDIEKGICVIDPPPGLLDANLS